MPITEDNPQNPAASQPTSPPTVQIDPAALAAALRQAGLAAAPQSQEPVSQFQTAIAQLRQNDSDPDAINTLETLFNGFRQDMTKEQQNEIGKVIQAERIRAANQLLADEIQRVIESDEDLERYSKAVEKLVGDEFTNDPSHEAERQRLFREGASQKFIRQLVNKHFTALAGDNKKKSSGLSGMTGSQNQTQAAAAQASKAQPGNVAELNEAQRSLYYSIVSEAEKVGLKALGKTKDEVEADAFKRASAKFR